MTTSARTPATGTPGYSEVMPCVPASARRARGLVSIALQLWGLDSLTDAGLLVVSELVTNVLDHTQCPQLHVSVHRPDDDRARIVVADGSPHAPKVTRTDGDSLRVGDACVAMAGATARGLCGAWGISTWDPRPMAVDAGSLPSPPHVLMVRAGLLVSQGVLKAAETLVQRWRPEAIWGMSPFAGSMSDAVWEKIDPRLFLREPHAATRAQAAFRAAFHLPDVEAVAVGTDNPKHLRQLTDSLTTEVDQTAISQYRRLLQAHHQKRNP